MDLFALQARLTLDISKFEDAIRQAEEKFNGFGDKLKTSGEKLQTTGQGMQEVGSKIESVGQKFSPLSNAVQDFGKQSIDVTASFDKAMSNVSAISGATGGDLNLLRDTAKEWGRSTEYTATQVADAFSYMGMAGWKSEEMIAGIGPVLNLATASGEDLATTSDIVTDALTAFGLTANDAKGFTDVLAAASTNANTNVGMMGESFKYAAPIVGTLFANAAGGAEQASKDTAVALGLMANSGIKASQAGTSLRSILTNMSKPTTQVQAAMDELGFSLTNADGSTKSLGQVMVELRSEFGSLGGMTDKQKESLMALSGELESGKITEEEYNQKLAELTKGLGDSSDAHKVQLAAMLAGKYGMSGLMAIVNATEEDFAQLTDAVEHSSDATDGYNGAAEKMSGIMRDNLVGDTQKLNSAVEGFQISLGEAMMPTVRDLIQQATKMMDWLNSLDGGTKDMIIKVGLLVAALSPVLSVGGRIISGTGSIVGGLGSIMSTIGGTVIPGIAGGGGLIATIGHLATAAAPFLVGGAIIAGIVAAVVLIVKHWDDIKAAAGRLKDTVIENWNRMKEGISIVFDKIKNVASTIWSGITGIFETAFSKIANLVSYVFTPIIGTIENVLSNMSEFWSGIFDGIYNTASDIFDSISSTVGNFIEYWQDAFGTIGEIASDILGGVAETISDAWEAVKGFAGKISNFFSGGGSSSRYLSPYDVEWHDKAADSPYIFRGATVFGAGETDDEILYGRDNLMQDIRAAVSDSGRTDKLYNLLSEYLPEILDRSSKEIVLDDGTLVGRMDRRMGYSANAYRRGV